MGNIKAFEDGSILSPNSHAILGSIAGMGVLTLLAIPFPVMHLPVILLSMAAGAGAGYKIGQHRNRTHQPSVS